MVLACLLHIDLVSLCTNCLQMKRNQIRKGMVIVDPGLNPCACWEFEGDILVLHHPTTISTKYQAMGEIVACCIDIVVIYIIIALGSSLWQH